MFHPIFLKLFHFLWPNYDFPAQETKPSTAALNNLIILYSQACHWCKLYSMKAPSLCGIESCPPYLPSLAGPAIFILKVAYSLSLASLISLLIWILRIWQGIQVPQIALSLFLLLWLNCYIHIPLLQSPWQWGQIFSQQDLFFSSSSELTIHFFL